MNNSPFKRYKVIISGITALRQHRRPEPGDPESPSIGGRIPTEEEQDILFKRARYYDKKIGYYQPSSQIRKAIVLSGKKESIPGQGKSKFSKLLEAGGIIVEPEKIPHKNQKDVKTAGHWTADWKGNQKWVVKAEVHDWQLEFIIQNNMPEIITDEYLKKFLDWAGMFCGLGADRPERGKLYGRFEVKQFKQIK